MCKVQLWFFCWWRKKKMDEKRFRSMTKIGHSLRRILAMFWGPIWPSHMWMICFYVF
jgi:hypothetical protein